jgi:diguanylate cyclase (GGDEF)-like protein
LHAWREEVLTLTTRVVLLLLLPTAIPAAILSFSIQAYWRLAFDLIALASVAVVALLPRLGFWLRTALMLGITYTAGTTWLLVSGLVGTGRIHFFLLIVLAALLLNLRGTLLVLLLALLTMAAIYAGFATDLLPLPLAIVERMFTTTTLVTNWLVQVMVSAAIAAAIVLTVHRLQQSLQTAQAASDELLSLNAELEQHIAERTDRLIQLNSSLQAEMAEHKQAEESLHWRVQQLEALRETLHEITSELELQPLLNAILERALGLLNAASGQVALYHPDTDELEILAEINMDSAMVGKRQPLSAGGTRDVIHAREPVVIADYQHWQGRLPQYAYQQGHALLLLPLLAGDAVLGILIVGHHDPARAFDDDDVQLLTLFAQQATIALHNARLFAEVQRLATTDSLTGLHNRRSFFEAARRSWEHAVRYGAPLSVLMLDIDHFKRVNDHLGHLAGDQVLQAVAYGCLTTLRAVDVVARYGGEEIVIVLPETNSQQAWFVAERLRRALSEQAITTDRGPVMLTVSLGVASMATLLPLSLEQLIERADQALYAAKRAGRNRVILWSPDLVTGPGADSQTNLP